VLEERQIVSRTLDGLLVLVKPPEKILLCHLLDLGGDPARYLVKNAPEAVPDTAVLFRRLHEAVQPGERELTLADLLGVGGTGTAKQDAPAAGAGASDATA
jgi:hypothetical protein